MPPYKVLVSIEILQLDRPSSSNRKNILSFLESLGHNPHLKGDYEDMDDAGRPVQIKIVGDFALTYWSDHAVKEVKVTKFEKADRN